LKELYLFFGFPNCHFCTLQWNVQQVTHLQRMAKKPQSSDLWTL
jgi:hypothetical protein